MVDSRVNDRSSERTLQKSATEWELGNRKYKENNNAMERWMKKKNKNDFKYEKKRKELDPARWNLVGAWTKNAPSRYLNIYNVISRCPWTFFVVRPIDRGLRDPVQSEKTGEGGS